MGRIVVGVDGSGPSKAALAWALGQAKLTGATVEAVLAWHYPVIVTGMPFAPVPVLQSDFAAQAEQILQDAMADVLPADSPVKVTAAAREGNAAQVLTGCSDDADLLVVGNRGYGGFTEALVGSVSQHCVHHARCPVVVVRDGDQNGREHPAPDVEEQDVGAGRKES